MIDSRKQFLVKAGVAGTALAALQAASVSAQDAETTFNQKKVPVAPVTGMPTVVLVHGAWANGSSWSKIVPMLQAASVPVVAVSLPLTTFADDVATTTRALTDITGPIVLVGHSYGGMVITEAGVNDRVKALVYVAAFAPSIGQSALDLQKPYPDAPVGAEIRPDSAGYLHLTTSGVARDFAQQLSAPESAGLAVTQGPIFNGCFGAKATRTAWNGKPSWFVVPSDDRAIQPQLHVDSAKKIGAKTTTIASDHVAMLSHPNEVANVILEAARSAKV